LRLTAKRLVLGEDPVVDGAALGESTRARPAPALGGLVKAVGRRAPKVLPDKAVPYSMLSAVLFTLAPRPKRKPALVHLGIRAAADAPEGEYLTFAVSLFESPDALAPMPPCKVVAKPKKVQGGLAKKLKAIARAMRPLKPVFPVCYARERLEPQRGKLRLTLSVDGSGKVTDVTVDEGDEFGGEGATACVTGLLQTLELPEGKGGEASEVRVNVAYRVSKPKRAPRVEPRGASDVVLKVGVAASTLIVGDKPPLTFPAPPNPMQQKALAAKLIGIYAALSDEFRLFVVPEADLAWEALAATLSTVFSVTDSEGEALYGGFTYLVPADDPLGE